MAGYRCYILDAEDHILQAHDLTCESDAEAESEAKSLLAQDPYHRSAEVWLATRRVARLERQAGLALDSAAMRHAQEDRSFRSPDSRR